MTEIKKRLTTSAMIASIASEGQRTTAAPFGKTLVDLARNNPAIVGMTADLAKYTDLHLFKEAYPERFVQMGMAEQLLMAAAGGMARMDLSTAKDNYPAQSAYETLGWVRDEIFCTYSKRIKI